MGMDKHRELLELVEEYTCGSQLRYRFRVKDTNIVLNITANSTDEAWSKAIKMFNELRINEVVEEVKRRYKEGLQRYLKRSKT